MTIRHVLYFLAVIDNECSITKASKSLNVAQPAVSQTILDLEREYGFQLFNRLNRKLYITKEAEKLLPYARHLIDSYKTLETVCNTKDIELPLRVGATLTVGTSFMPCFLKKNSLPIDMSVLNTSEVEKAVLDSRLDVAIVEGTITSSDIIEIECASDHLIAVKSPQLKNTQRWILREKGSGTRDLSERLFFIEKNVWSIANTQTIIELVKEGQGMSIISNTLVKKELAVGSLIDCTKEFLKKGNSKRTFRIAFHKDKLIDERMRFFIDRACYYGSRDFLF